VGAAVGRAFLGTVAEGASLFGEPVTTDNRGEDVGAVAVSKGFLATVLSEQPEVVGVLPKGVSRSDLHCARGDGEWRCQVLVDV
jgi:hypothetical protein